MCFLLAISLAAIVGNGVFGSANDRQRSGEIHSTKPDAELPMIHTDKNLGAKVNINGDHPNHVPDAEPPEIRTDKNLGAKVDISGDRPAHGDASPHGFLERDFPKRTRAQSRSLPSRPTVMEKTGSAGLKAFLEPRPSVPSPVKAGQLCPNRVSAFCTVGDKSYLFSHDYVYTIRDDKVIDVVPISHIFPNGPSSVTAAVYDKDRFVVLLKDRTVYAYRHTNSGKFELDKAFPKNLPNNIVFTPAGAMRWHDKRQVLLSNDGRFALYDEYWNKSLMTAQVKDYFLGLPENVQGISEWKNDEAKIFTPNLVFTYRVHSKRVDGDGIPLSTFFHCD